VQLDSERSCAPTFRIKSINIEKLHNSNVLASRFRCLPTRGEKTRKNFLAVFQWNPFAGIAHGNFRHLAAPAQDQPQLRR